MYIFWIFFFYFLFFNNLSNGFLYILVLTFLVFFFYTKNLIFFLEPYSLTEDRFIILLENITRVEYNLIFIILFCLIIFFVLFYSINKFFITFILFCSSNTCSYFFFQDFYYFLFYQFKFNTKLLNGLFLIHPFLIYLFYAFFLVIGFVFIYLKKNSFYRKNCLKNLDFNILKYFIITVFLGLSAIILGSWWAFQEINWNGWWSWDLIEIVNFLLILFILRHLHSKVVDNINVSMHFSNYPIKLVLLPIFFIIISRFNLVNSLHSFVLLENFSQFYFLINYYLLFVIFLFWNASLNFIKNFLNKQHMFKVNFLVFFFYFLFNIFFFKLIYELSIFFFNFQSFLEYFYFFKHYLYFSILFLNLLITDVLPYFFLILCNISTISFIEFFFFIYICKILYFKGLRFFKWHFLIFIFIFLNFFYTYILDFSFKNWTYNFFPFIENFKINFILTKIEIKSFIVNFKNTLPININSYSIISVDYSLINYSKSNLYFLSTFDVNFNSFSICSYKFFFYYTFVFSKYLSYYYVIYLIVFFYIYLLKKKLGKNKF